MVKSNKNRLILVLLVIILIIGVFGVLSSLDSDVSFVDDLITPKDEITCTVVISNPLFADMQIESSVCRKVGSCYKLLTLGKPFSLFEDKGELVIQTDDSSNEINVRVPETVGKPFNIKVCTNNDKGQLLLYDEDGIQVSSDLVNW